MRKRNALITYRVIVLVLALAVAFMPTSSLAKKKNTTWRGLYKGLEKHQKVIETTSDELIFGTYSLQQEAIDDNGGKRLGDFMFYENLKKIKWKSKWETDGTIEYRFVVKYKYDLNTMKRFNRELKGVVRSLGLSKKDGITKVVTIHDYIVNNVKYEDSGDPMDYSAAGALLNKKAVCEGFALLFYRMCKESGVPVRFITGYGVHYGGIGAHAWNIVKLGDKWYNIDTTWDTVSKNEFFLRSDGDFYGHVRDHAYSTEDFYSKYPMSDVSINHP